MANGILNLASGLQGAFDKAYGAYTTERSYLDKKAENEEEKKYKQGLLKQSQEQKLYERTKGEKELGLKESNAANEMLAKGFIKDPMSGEYVRSPEASEKEKADLAYKKALTDKARKEKGSDPKSDISMQLAELKLKEQQDKQSPEGKYLALPDAAKNRAGLIANAMQNINQGKELYSKGERPSYITSSTPVLGSMPMIGGDNPLDVTYRTASEEVGRLQSQGAVTPDEEKKFNAMLPGRGDSKEVAEIKFKNAMAFLEQKLQAQGLTGDALPEKFFDKQKMGLIKQTPKPSPQNPGLLGGDIQSSQAAPISDQKQMFDIEGAKQFIQSNPNDPKAQAVKQRLIELGELR
jgi:hypothetical protein